MMLTIDEGYQHINEVVDYYSTFQLASPNEAETRKKVIDAILEGVLGWDPKTDITYEERVQEDGTTKYADYTINTASLSIVVEAKRAGIAFKLPNKKTSAKLGGVIREGEVGKALVQVRDYARKLAIPFAVATNGNAWIIFPAVRTDGISYEDTQAKIFRSLADIRSRFVEFWELLSKQRVVEGGLENTFFGHPEDDFSRRLISILPEPGYKLGRNSIYEHIEPAISTALYDESLINNTDALEYCYVKTTERIKFDARIQMHLNDTRPPLGRKTIRPRRSNKTQHLDEKLSATRLKQPQFILLLGPVGAGKTTFIHYTRKVSAAEIINEYIGWFVIDFKKATENINPRKFIYDQLLDIIESDDEFNLGEWESSIRPAYADMIANLRRGPLSNLYKSSTNDFDIKVSEQIFAERNQVEPYVNRIISHFTKKTLAFLSSTMWINYRTILSKKIFSSKLSLLRD